MTLTQFNWGSPVHWSFSQMVNPLLSLLLFRFHCSLSQQHSWQYPKLPCLFVFSLHPFGKTQCWLNLSVFPRPVTDWLTSTTERADCYNINSWILLQKGPSIFPLILPCFSTLLLSSRSIFKPPPLYSNLRPTSLFSPPSSTANQYLLCK